MGHIRSDIAFILVEHLLNEAYGLIAVDSMLPATLAVVDLAEGCGDRVVQIYMGAIGRFGGCRRWSSRVCLGVMYVLQISWEGVTQGRVGLILVLIINPWVQLVCGLKWVELNHKNINGA
jgi:hypothetical protein